MKHTPVTSPMAWRISITSPLPLALATAMAPPVAREVNSSDTMPFTVPTRDTAAMAASPRRDTSMVDRSPIKKIKN